MDSGSKEVGYFISELQGFVRDDLRFQPFLGAERPGLVSDTQSGLEPVNLVRAEGSEGCFWQAFLRSLCGGLQCPPKGGRGLISSLAANKFLEAG